VDRAGPPVFAGTWNIGNDAGGVPFSVTRPSLRLSVVNGSIERLAIVRNSDSADCHGWVR
jgi:hypothetical protein